MYIICPFISGPDILRDLSDEEDGDAKPPGTSDGNDSSSPKKPALNWNGKPKTMAQMAGEAVVARIVAKVKLKEKYNCFVMAVGERMLWSYSLWWIITRHPSFGRYSHMSS